MPFFFQVLIQQPFGELTKKVRRKRKEKCDQYRTVPPSLKPLAHELYGTAIRVQGLPLAAKGRDGSCSFFFACLFVCYPRFASFPPVS